MDCILDYNLGDASVCLKVLGRVKAKTRYLARKAYLQNSYINDQVLLSSVILTIVSVLGIGPLYKKTETETSSGTKQTGESHPGPEPRSHVVRCQFLQLNWLPVGDGARQIHRSIPDKI